MSFIDICEPAAEPARGTGQAGSPLCGIGLGYGTKSCAWSWVGCCSWLPPAASLWDGEKWSHPPALLFLCEAQGEGDDREGEGRENLCHKGRGSRLKLGIERPEYVAGTEAALLPNCSKPAQGYP